MADVTLHCCSKSQRGVDMENLKEKGLAYVLLTDCRINVNGREIEHAASGNQLLTEIYRSHIADWAKFFKMDTLSKVGFCASEMLLKELNFARFCGEEYTSGTAIVLFGATASLCADKNYQDTIADKDNFYPSPALFVYTLPNIVTGEIAIRNHFRGETQFFVTDSMCAAQMARHIAQAFMDPVTERVLAGWVDCHDNDSFRSFMTMVGKEQAENLEWLSDQIDKIMKMN